MTWHISGYIAVVFLLHTYVVCFTETILVLRRGVSIFENKGFLISIVLLTHSTLFFAPPGLVDVLTCKRGFWKISGDGYL